MPTRAPSKTPTSQKPTPPPPGPKPKPSAKPAPKQKSPPTTKRPPRAPGRPAASDTDQRTRLLDAALRCFARTGISATTLRAIASEADVTPALVNYYFGNRERVVDAVIEERFLPLLGGMRHAVETAGDDPARLIAGFIAAVGALVEAHPWFPALWVREVLSEGGALRTLLIERVGPMLPQQLARRFAAAQARGALNPDLDPRLLVVSLIGLTLFPIAGRPLWQGIFNTGDLGFDALQTHVLTLLHRGLEFDHGN